MLGKFSDKGMKQLILLAGFRLLERSDIDTVRLAAKIIADLSADFFAEIVKLMIVSDHGFNLRVSKADWVASRAICTKCK